MKVHVRVKTIEDKIAEYVDNHPEDIYIDYSDELSNEQVNKILEGKADSVRWEIEDNIDYAFTPEDFSYYWENLIDEVGCTQDDIDDWLEDGGFYPAHSLDDHGWRQLLRNTKVYITGTVWEADWNFNNWAYGGPVTYSDVKESLKILGVNPYEFKKLQSGGSQTQGPGELKGWFPDMPQREPKIDTKDLWDNTIVLFDGVLNFCIGDLENIAEVLKEESKEITFTKGTNVVMYDFGNGAGITEVELTSDVTIARKKVTFRNDAENTYGIQECFGFVHSYWAQGGIRREK